jgi:molecular chaperone DnaK (HSP70)
MSNELHKVFGIDLGTTYSSIAYVDEYGKSVIIPNAENQRITPSVVFFDGGNIVVGDVAKESAKIYPQDVVGFIKRSMGEPNYIFERNNKTYRPEEISSFILRKLIQDAEMVTGDKIKDVVITCPAYFGINEREATRIAGEIAGLNVRQIINEPTSAAIAYGSATQDERSVVLVYDLGGGTFDVTLISIEPDAIEVICTGGDHNLGGKDWDDRIVANLVQEFQKATGSTEDILEDPDTCQDLQLAAERSKKVLSQRDRTPVSITHGGERVKVELKREKFEEITQDLLERTILLTHEIIDEANKKGTHQIDEIILVGGSTRMPQISQRIQEEFNITPKSFDPDEAVAKGAAIYAWKLALNDSLIQRIAQKTNTPVHDIQNISDFSDDQVKEAAREVADATGYTLPAVKSSVVKVRDVSSKSFGVVVHNPEGEEVVYNVVMRNTRVPVQAKKRFFTAVHNQKTVFIRIMECESSEQTVPTDQAIEIGTAALNLPSDLPADTPVEINFNLNKEGCLQITAIETAESRKVAVSIETTCVIQGEELSEAIDRNQGLVVH